MAKASEGGGLGERRSQLNQKRRGVGRAITRFIECHDKRDRMEQGCKVSIIENASYKQEGAPGITQYFRMPLVFFQRLPLPLLPLKAHTENTEVRILIESKNKALTSD